MDKSEFNTALDSYYAQHHCLPSDLSAVHKPGLPPVLTDIGKVKEITYEPTKESRKYPFWYRHEMDDTHLVADANGKRLLLLGQTYLDNKDGWLKK